jgi:hypothetical protein
MAYYWCGNHAIPNNNTTMNNTNNNNINNSVLVRIAIHTSNAITRITQLPSNAYACIARLLRSEPKATQKDIEELRQQVIAAEENISEFNEKLDALSEEEHEFSSRDYKNIAESVTEYIDFESEITNHSDTIRECITDYYNIDDMLNEDAVNDLLHEKDYVTKDEVSEMVNKKATELFNERMTGMSNEHYQQLIKPYVLRALHDILTLAVTSHYMKSTNDNNNEIRSDSNQ